MDLCVGLLACDENNNKKLKCERRKRGKSKNKKRKTLCEEQRWNSCPRKTRGVRGNEKENGVRRRKMKQT